MDTFSQLDNTPTIMIREGGTYAVDVLSIENGCRGDATILIEENSDSIRIEQLIIEQPHCNNGYDAFIEVANVTGASGQVTYTINGGLQSLDPRFASLSSGSYVIQVTDEFGCTDTDTASIDDVIIRFVDIERDTVLQLGADLFVPSTDNYTEDLIISKLWTVGDEMVCDGCDSLYFQPTASGQYVLTITDTNGCVVSDSILVNVISIPALYIPNAFSPNGDGINDDIGPYFGNNVAVVHDFSIYSRWGEKVHHRTMMSPDHLGLFWDGYHRGQVLAPGLFVYSIQIELIDGRVVERKGEIHLLR